MVDVIAEWGQTHGGSVANALGQVAATRLTGCRYAKFQFLDPEKIAAGYAPAYWTHAAPGELQRDTFTRNGRIDFGAWREIRAACDEHEVEFVSTPFDLDALEDLLALEPAAVKIASGDITYRELLREVRATWKGGPVFLSTGASTLGEIEQALESLEGCNVTLLACSLVYPCPWERADLGRIHTLLHAFCLPTGYSDHTEQQNTGMLAVAAGATLLEKHATITPRGECPDDQMGLTPGRLRNYVTMAESAVLAMGNGLVEPSKAEAAARIGARRSWHATQDLEAGHTVRPGDVIALRPCLEGSLSADVDMTGFRLKYPVRRGEPLRAPWHSEPYIEDTSATTDG